jgi:hypothetical protein
VKLWAAITLNRQGWLTRQEGQRVQGQEEIVRTGTEVRLHAGQG